MDPEVCPTMPERPDRGSMSVLDVIFLSCELGGFDLHRFDACRLLMIY